MNSLKKNRAFPDRERNKENLMRAFGSTYYHTGKYVLRDRNVDPYSSHLSIITVYTYVVYGMV